MKETCFVFVVFDCETVNNAGSGGLVDIFGDLDPQDLNQVYQTNVNGPLYMINAVVPHMPTGGRIVNVSSTQAQRGHNMLLSYAASKAALDNLTWSLAGVVCILCDTSGPVERLIRTMIVVGKK